MNTERIKKQIQNAINKFPTVVNLKRKNSSSDSNLGGVTPGAEISVGTYNGYLDKKNIQFRLTVNEAQSKGTVSYTILFIDVPCQKGDYFVVNGKTFRIIDIDLVFGIYQSCQLEVL